MIAAHFLIVNTASGCRLTPAPANLVVAMSFGASKAATDYASCSDKS